MRRIGLDEGFVDRDVLPCFSPARVRSVSDPVPEQIDEVAALNLRDRHEGNRVDGPAPSRSSCGCDREQERSSGLPCSTSNSSTRRSSSADVALKSCKHASVGLDQRVRDSPAVTSASAASRPSSPASGQSIETPSTAAPSSSARREGSPARVADGDETARATRGHPPRSPRCPRKGMSLRGPERVAQGRPFSRHAMRCASSEHR